MYYNYSCKIEGTQDLVGSPHGTHSILVSPHGVRARRGFAFVSNVGAHVAARSARCSRWLSRTVKLVYKVLSGRLEGTVYTYCFLLLVRLLIVDTINLSTMVIHLTVKRA